MSDFARFFDNWVPFFTLAILGLSSVRVAEGCPALHYPELDHLDRVRVCRYDSQCSYGYRCMQSVTDVMMCCTPRPTADFYPPPRPPPISAPSTHQFQQPPPQLPNPYIQHAQSMHGYPPSNRVDDVARSWESFYLLQQHQQPPGTTKDKDKADDSKSEKADEKPKPAADSPKSTEPPAPKTDKPTKPPPATKGPAPVIPKPVIPTQPFAPPYVFPLIVGRYTPTLDPNVVTKVGSITLITENNINMLVDTGVPSSQSDIIRGLSQRGLRPEQIYVVVSTHGHPDHVGNQGLFTAALFLYSNWFYMGDEFMTNNLTREASIKLTENIDVHRTPGHTDESISVIVRNVPCCGTVAITDTFYTDSDFPNLWKPFSKDPKAQETNRNKIICLANWIIPIHGRMFQVTMEMLRNANCRSAIANDDRRRTKTRIKRTAPAVLIRDKLLK